MRRSDERTGEKVFDFDEALERLAGRSEYLKKVVERFIDDSPAQFDELARALRGQFFPEAVRLAHGLGGAASMVGASRVHRQAQALETALKNPHQDGLADLHRDLLAEFEDFRTEIAAFVWPAPG